MDGVFYVVVFLTFATQTKCLDNVVNFNIPKSKFGLKLENSIIETKYDVHVFASCARECFYVSQCRSFSYNRLDAICLLNSLNSTEADVADFVEEDKYIHSDLGDWVKEMVLTCADKPCSLKEKCTPYRPHSCVAYCGNPDTIEHGNIDRGGVLEGAVRNYTCVALHAPTSPDTYVTCQSNSEWTERNFLCVAYCGEPNSVPRAGINSGGVLEGSVRTYTCIARHTPTSPDTSVTCQSNSEWTNPNFNCIENCGKDPCKEGVVVWRAVVGRERCIEYAHCGSPPIVKNADVSAGEETQDKIRTYTCREPYTASTNLMTIRCQHNTYWTSPAFTCQLITTCQEVRSCNPSYGDGEYWLVLDNFDTSRRMKIRCNNMAGTPYETLTLDTKWRTWFKNPLGQHHNGYYQDIQIDVKTLRLFDANTDTGTNSCMLGYGSVKAHFTCHMTEYQMDFYLKNTGFWFNPIPTWYFASGNTQSIDVAENLSNKKIEVSGYISLNNGHVEYTGRFTLKIDENEGKEQKTGPIQLADKIFKNVEADWRPGP